MANSAAFEQFSEAIESLRWHDPEQVARVGRKMTGLEHIRAMIDGRLPPAPMMAVLDLAITDADTGSVTMTCTPQPRHYNPMGGIHGGLAASLIDSASGLAIYSLLGPADYWTTVNLRIDYLRPMTHQTGSTTCTGTVVRAGRRIGIADAEIVGADGKVLARGNSTCIILRDSVRT